MTWEAFVSEDFPTMGARLYLRDSYGRDARYVVRLGAERADLELTQFEEASGAYCGLYLPRDAAEPLRDALDVYLGKPRDDWRSKYEEARDALELERRRVDSLLSVVHNRNEETA